MSCRVVLEPGAPGSIVLVGLVHCIRGVVVARSPMCHLRPQPTPALAQTSRTIPTQAKTPGKVLRSKWTKTGTSTLCAATLHSRECAPRTRPLYFLHCHTLHAAWALPHQRHPSRPARPYSTRATVPSQMLSLIHASARQVLPRRMQRQPHHGLSRIQMGWSRLPTLAWPKPHRLLHQNPRTKTSFQLPRIERDSGPACRPYHRQHKPGGAVAHHIEPRHE